MAHSAYVPSAAGGAVSSVANADGTLDVSPTTGAVVAALDTAHPNVWTDSQIIRSGLASAQSAPLTLSGLSASNMPSYLLDCRNDPLNNAQVANIGTDGSFNGEGDCSINGMFWGNGQHIINLDAGNIALGAVAIIHGGTGAVSASAGLNNLLPPQAGNAGMVLGTDGTNAVWQSMPATSTEAEWSYSTNNTMADPGSGNFRTNTTAWSTVTALAVNRLTNNGVDRTNLLSAVQVNDTVLVNTKANSSNFARYKVSGAVVNNTTWFQVPVTQVAVGGTPPGNNTACILTFK